MPLSKTDMMLLQRCARGPVYYTHGIDMAGKAAKLVRSTLSPKQQKPLRELALGGYLAEIRTASGGPGGGPPETTVTYSLTALGRQVLGIRAPTPVPQNRSQPLTDAELEAEGLA